MSDDIKVAFPTDEHFPFQDERARSVAMKIVHDFDPHIMSAGSDGVDFYALSKFDKDPKRSWNLQKEIDAWAAGQREWKDAAPNAVRFFVPGNHEDRLRRYLWSQAPALASLRSMELSNLMQLHDLGIQDTPNGEIIIGESLVIKHGSLVRKNSAYSARAEMESEAFSISVFTGHTHRGGSTFVRTRGGVVSAHEGFCLCDLNPEYVDRPNWQQGILLATVSEDGLLSVEPVVFFQRWNQTVAHWRGKEYHS